MAQPAGETPFLQKKDFPRAPFSKKLFKGFAGLP
jgi:hypothetical protein